MATIVEPLDPNSEKGRAIAAELSQVLAEIYLEIAARRAAREAATRRQEVEAA